MANFVNAVALSQSFSHIMQNFYLTFTPNIEINTIYTDIGLVQYILPYKYNNIPYMSKSNKYFYVCIKMSVQSVLTKSILIKLESSYNNIMLIWMFIFDSWVSYFLMEFLFSSFLLDLIIFCKCDISIIISFFFFVDWLYAELLEKISFISESSVIISIWIVYKYFR